MEEKKISGICQNPGCSNPVEQVVDPARGHRSRKYCCDSCKSAAFRQRKLEQERQEQERLRLEMEEHRRQQLRQQYGEDLLPETIEFLRRQGNNSNSLTVSAIAATIRAEINRVTAAHASQSQEEEERSILVQKMMELGEPDYHSIIVECEGHTEFVVLGGRPAWQGFADKASLEHLRAIYEMYIAPIERAEQQRAARQSFVPGGHHEP